MKGLWITTDNVVTEREVTGDRLYSLYDGMFEIVRPTGLTRPLVFLVDESGVIKGLPDNQTGCVLYGTAKHGHRIAGDILILKETMGEEGYELTGLSDGDLRALADKYDIRPTINHSVRKKKQERY